MATERRNFTVEEIEAVWKKAYPQESNNPDVFRNDYAGAWIKKEDYGKETNFGWEIDHLRPLVKDGDYSLDNLYPLHWQNNRKKGDSYPQWKTCISSDGVANVEQEQSWKIG